MNSFNDFLECIIYDFLYFKIKCITFIMILKWTIYNAIFDANAEAFFFGTLKYGAASHVGMLYP